MKFRRLRKKTILKADGKELVFKNGVCTVAKETKDIKALVDSKYIEEIKDNETTSK